MPTQPTSASPSERSDLLDRAASGSAVVFLLGCLGFILYKLHFGVDFDDEAFYLAIPYRFVLGDRPFVDELDFQQTAGFLTLPVVKLWYALYGNLDGIVLFLRRLYYVFSLCVGFAVFLCFRNQHGSLTAALAGAFPVVFVPFCIPTFSYNTLGMGFMSLGLYLVWMSRDAARPHLHALGAGIAHALACVAFPPYALGVLVLAVVMLAAPAGKRWRFFICYTAPIALVGAILGGYLLLSGWEGLAQSLTYTSSATQSGTAKLGAIARQFDANLQHKGLLLGWLALAVGSRRLGWRIATPLFAACPLAVWWSIKPAPEHLRCLEFVAYYGLLAPVLALGASRYRTASKLLVVVWAPSVVFGALNAWSAANGFVNSALGLAPAAMVTTYLLVSLVREEQVTPRSSLIPHWAPVVLVNLVVLIATLPVVYRDDLLPRLDAKVASGPYAGLHTSLYRHYFLEEVQSTLRSLARPEGRILVYSGFAAGYLLTEMRPALPFVWLFHAPPFRPIYASYYRRSLRPENLVLFMRWGDQGFSRDDPLHALVERSHRRIVNEPTFAIYSGSR